MKKVLFATSALVASAGFAAADVSLSGYAEMGITGGSGSTETQFHQDVDVTFSMSGTTDNGLTFGTSVDLDENAAGVGTDDAGVAVFISGSFGTLTMGDTNGALDWATSEAPTGSGSIADDESSHAGYSSVNGLDATFDNQILSYTHSVGALGFAVSIEMDDTGDADAESVVGFGARYSVGDLGIGIGFQSGTDVDGDELDAVAASLSYSMGDLSVGIVYQQLSNSTWADDQTDVGLGVSYSMDAITMGFNYGTRDSVGGTAGNDQAGFGISVGYDLGGGASLKIGYGDTTDDGTGASGDSTWSLGLTMGF
ncbi:porin [Nioella sp.]|uniref:porin n=1 Tax=Nioella sp. TaxID=1912091 RepID=UPI0035132F82